MIPHLGVQTDEALFVGGIYQAKAAYFTVGARHVPLMLSSYNGTLKSLIYAPVFRLWTPNASSTRTPVLLMGVATIWLFYLLLRRISGTAAAVAGCLLLATDSIFLLTTLFDWGPVALQHLLLVAALVLLYRYYESGGYLVLTGGFFLLGLGMWDKALFIWSLSALAVAAAAVFPRVLMRLFTWKAAAVALVGFGLGAGPLIWFNLATGGETFRTNLAGSRESPLKKFPMVLNTVRGDGLFAWMVRDDNDGAPPLAPRTWLARASEGLRGATGHRRRNLMPWALAGALLLLGPLARRSGARAPRAMLFAAIFCVVAWLEMACNQGTGGAVHHVVLLWPFPHLFVAAAFGEAAERLGRAGAAAMAVLLLAALPANLLVTNEYYRMLLRNGGGLSWSDALSPLAGFLRGTAATQVIAIDWGIFDSVRLLSAGKVPLRPGVDPLNKPELDARDREAVRQWLIQPGTVFAAHTDGCEFFPGVNRHLDEVAAANGMARETMAVIHDRNGRAIFQVLRYR